MSQSTTDTCRIYEAYRYAADGHGGEVGDGEVIATGTLEEVRAEIARRIDGDLDEMRWGGTDEDVEAYHESRAEGAGGYAVREAKRQEFVPASLIYAHGSEGFIGFTRGLGLVVDREGYEHIHRVDVWRYKETNGMLRGDDILAFGYWDAQGNYEHPVWPED